MNGRSKFLGRLLLLALCTSLRANGDIDPIMMMPLLSPPTPPATPAGGTDRKGASKAAAALAVAGAAVSGVSCVYLMQAASNEPSSSTKTMMQMMAMKQCSQTAQNLANALQNTAGSEAASDPAVAVPSSASIDASPLTSPTATQGPNYTVETSRAVEEMPKATTGEPTDRSAGVAEPSAFAQRIEGEAPKTTEVATAKAESFSALNPIGQTKVFFDKGGADASFAGFFPGTAHAVASSKAPGEGDGGGNGATAEGERQTGRRRRGITQHQDSAEGQSAATGSTPAPESENDPMDAILRLMGPKADPTAPGISDVAGPVVTTSTANPEGPASVNLFQYASYTYRRVVPHRPIPSRLAVRHSSS